MTSWYAFSLAALLLIGLQRFLYKVAASRDVDTALTTFSFMLTVAVLSSLIFALVPSRVNNISILLITAFLNSLAFVTATMAHIQALKYLSASIAYPLIRLNILVVVLFSVIFLGEDLLPRQWAGIAFALGTVFLLGRQAHPVSQQTQEKALTGFALVILAMFAGALASISCKIGAEYTSLSAFVALSYILSTIFSLIFIGRKRQKLFSSPKDAPAIGIGFLMGLLNLAGFFAFLQALSIGPLSLVAPINGMHFVVAVALSLIIYRERLSLSLLAGLGLTVISLLLLR